MDIKSYIDEGNLEQYCFELDNVSLGNEIAALRLGHPEIGQELNRIELSIEELAKTHAITPSLQLKGRIMAALGIAEEVLDLNHLPPTSKYSNYESWLKAVEHLIPAAPFDDFFAHVLQQNEQMAQTLVITKLNVPDEVHDVVAESFFILEGTCTCTVGHEVFTLNAGDYLAIPLHTNHDIRIDSPYVIAILQHQFV
ncbi:mannose-6-phosphate isomerase-like protein (cupin superfamily) [Pedobacter cryoconitis]|uniref:Mannose-6-phosphate isomerase-like protein (Cupin superfamily) n=1 Tax=Pedobacter cryoconitis TaxID=188932 RepID=A0A7W9DMC6_9SPHI|nr:cupin domain-containing protein [Pedobacter cryoconitis]MBB5624261.1 mannose-6-phosphate isomerase-like protein (cupin superfamily) [Pedobacter cryoconitis]